MFLCFRECSNNLRKAHTKDVAYVRTERWCTFWYPNFDRNPLFPKKWGHWPPIEGTQPPFENKGGSHQIISSSHQEKKIPTEIPTGGGLPAQIGSNKSLILDQLFFRKREANIIPFLGPWELPLDRSKFGPWKKILFFEVRARPRDLRMSSSWDEKAHSVLRQARVPWCLSRLVGLISRLS